ncbi:hypothetical protein D1BOALGB6SA_940 [Olavius sp. associated proteobacterium Delta 1]|nr:hypothetical protein D1BOALGB6SA_940 [Olavius sp. associated proteobacterium Delta 1]
MRNYQNFFYFLSRLYGGEPVSVNGAVSVNFLSRLYGGELPSRPEEV